MEAAIKLLSEADPASYLGVILTGLALLVAFIAYLVTTHLDVRSIKSSQNRMEKKMDSSFGRHSKLERRVTRLEILSGHRRPKGDTNDDDDDEEGSQDYSGGG